MIDFEEELKKFHPSLEVEDVEDTINHHEAEDLTELMMQMYRQESQTENKQ